MSRSNVSSTESETRSVSSSRSRGSIPQRPIAEERADRAGEDDAQLDVGERGEIADRLHPGGREPLPPPWGRRPAACERGTAPGTAPPCPGGTTVIPPGLRRSEATLQTTFEVETPSEHESEVAARTDVCTASATARAPVNVGDDRAEVEVALVDPDLLDPGHDLADRAPDRLGVLPVERVARPDEDDVGAAPQRLRRAHRRADPEAPRDVVRRRDDPAALRIAADDERLRPQRRVLELLDRGEERVEVEMGEYRHAGNGYGAAVLTAPPPPPAIEQPAPYQLSYGVVAGTAAPGTRRVIVRVGSRTLADKPLGHRHFQLRVALPPASRRSR